MDAFALATALSCAGAALGGLQPLTLPALHSLAQDLHWEKLNYMIARLGLRPWYLRANTQVQRSM